MSSLVLLLALIGVTLLPLGCSSGLGSSDAADQPTPTPIPTSIVPTNPTYEVQRGEVIKLLQFSGRVAPVLEEELFFKRNGYVDTVYIRRNDEVKEGDLLAELEVTDLKNQITQAEAELTATQMDNDRRVAQAAANVRAKELNLAKLEASISDSQLIGARINLERARENLTNAEIEYKESLERDWEKEEVRERYAKTLRDMQWNLEITQAQYTDAVRARERIAYDIELAQQDLNLAMMSMQEIESGVDVTRTLLSLQRLRDQLDEARIVAPFDGVILSSSLLAGTQIQGYKGVMVIADPTQLEVTADLQDSELSELTEGMPLTAELTNRPGEIVEGLIRLLPYPYGGGGSIAGVQDEDESARIALAKNFEELGLDMGDRVRITVELERSEDTLWLPPQAIRTFEGRNFVVVQESGGQRRVDVTIGIRSAERIEILNGVTEGQVVIAP